VEADQGGKTGVCKRKGRRCDKREAEKPSKTRAWKEDDEENREHDTDGVEGRKEEDEKENPENRPPCTTSTSDDLRTPSNTASVDLGTHGEKEAWLMCCESEVSQSSSEDEDEWEEDGSTLRIRPGKRLVHVNEKLTVLKKSQLDETKAYWVGGGQRTWEGKHKLSLYTDERSLKFNPATRQHMVEYVLACGIRLRSTRSTWHMALSYLDAYLRSRGIERFLGNWTTPPGGLMLSSGGGLPARCPWNPNKEAEPPLPGKLRRLATTALFVASKVLDNNRPSAADFASITCDASWSVQEVCKGERGIMRELDYRLYYPTSTAFAGAYLQALCLRSWEVRVVCMYLLDVSQLTVLALTNRPSLLAAAALQLSLSLVSTPFDTENDPSWSKIVGYSADALSPVMHKLRACHQDCMRRPFLSVNALNKKAMDLLRHLVEADTTHT